MNKWYMYFPESVLQNEAHNILRDLEIQIYHSLSARQPIIVIVNKKRPGHLRKFAVT